MGQDYDEVAQPSTLPIKLSLMLFFMFLVVTSHTFVNRIIAKFSNAVEHKHPTTYGIILQGIFLVLFFVVADACIKRGIL